MVSKRKPEDRLGLVKIPPGTKIVHVKTEAKPDPYVSLSISLPPDMADAVRGLQTTLVPGLRVQLSDVFRYLVPIALEARRLGLHAATMAETLNKGAR